MCFPINPAKLKTPGSTSTIAKVEFYANNCTFHAFIGSIASKK
jgi:hypothetical protein